MNFNDLIIFHCITYYTVIHLIISLILDMHVACSLFFSFHTHTLYFIFTRDK